MMETFSRAFHLMVFDTENIIEIVCVTWIFNLRLIFKSIFKHHFLFWFNFESANEQRPTQEVSWQWWAA